MNRTILVTAFAFFQILPSFGQDRGDPALSHALEIHAGGEPNYTWLDGTSDHTVSFLGDMRFEGAPVEGMPYSAESVTEIVQTLADGNRIRHENRAVIYRDSKGRTRREESLGKLGPWSTGGENKRIFINDPVSNTHWVLNPRDKTARKIEVPNLLARADGSTSAVKIIRRERHAAASAAVGPETPHVGDPPHDGAVAEARSIERRLVASAPGSDAAPTAESLGRRIIEGVEAKGTRYTTVVPAGQIGNEREIKVVFERWRSVELDVDVLTKRSDPRSGEFTYSLKNISRTDPLPTLFDPPADYEVVEGNVFFKQQIHE